MKTTLYMATSVNGYIADKDGNEDFLSHENWEMLCKLAGETGNIIWGRTTYEAVAKWDKGKYLEDLVNVEKIIISSDKSLELNNGYTLASSPQDALDKISTKKFKTALVSGGSQTNAAFAKLGLLDEIVLNIEPVVIGHGIPLFSADTFELQLELTSSTQNKNGIITLKYVVKKS